MASAPIDEGTPWYGTTILKSRLEKEWHGDVLAKAVYSVLLAASQRGTIS